MRADGCPFLLWPPARQMRLKNSTPKLPLWLSSKIPNSGPLSLRLSRYPWPRLHVNSRASSSAREPPFPPHIAARACTREMFKRIEKADRCTTVPLPGGSSHCREELRDRPRRHRDEEPLGHQGDAVAGQPWLCQDQVLVAQLLLHGEHPRGGGDDNGEGRLMEVSFFCSSPLRVWTTSESGSISPPRLFPPHTSSSSDRMLPRVA